MPARAGKRTPSPERLNQFDRETLADLARVLAHIYPSLTPEQMYEYDPRRLAFEAGRMSVLQDVQRALEAPR